MHNMENFTSPGLSIIIQWENVIGEWTLSILAPILSLSDWVPLSASVESIESYKSFA